ncbi:hypothetical protein M422DRAFT_40915 [Sphaerobolus stellatus SS14]|nr:hypothetical protein M422DRAFT_40915 [Sphaerobolus stellatus SS14]
MTDPGTTEDLSGESSDETYHEPEAYLDSSAEPLPTPSMRMIPGSNTANPTAPMVRSRTPPFLSPSFCDKRRIHHPVLHCCVQLDALRMLQAVAYNGPKVLLQPPQPSITILSPFECQDAGNFEAHKQVKQALDERDSTLSALEQALLKIKELEARNHMQAQETDFQRSNFIAAASHATLEAYKNSHLQGQIESKRQKRHKIVNTKGWLITSDEMAAALTQQIAEEEEHKRQEAEAQKAKEIAKKWDLEELILNKGIHTFTAPVKTMKKPELQALAFAMNLSREGTKGALTAFILGLFKEKPELKLDARFQGIFAKRRQGKTARIITQDEDPNNEQPVAGPSISGFAAVDSSDEQDVTTEEEGSFPLDPPLRDVRA